jgi:hypothetical protein
MVVQCNYFKLLLSKPLYLPSTCVSLIGQSQFLNGRHFYVILLFLGNIYGHKDRNYDV